jgi:hypothetical protein
VALLGPFSLPSVLFTSFALGTPLGWRL